MNRKKIATLIAIAFVVMATLFNQQAQAQGGGSGTGQMEIINGSSIVTDSSTGLNRIVCARDTSYYLQGLTLRFSLGFPDMGVVGRTQGSWTIRSIVFTNPEQVASYELDGRFNDSGHSLLNRTFTLVGTANYQNACTRGTPPPATPGTNSPNPGTVNITIQGTCGVRNRAGIIRPTDATFEASDAAGVIVRGRFKARVICTTGDTLNPSGINTSLDRH